VPSSDTFIEKDASINEHIEQMRLSATKALLERAMRDRCHRVGDLRSRRSSSPSFSMVLHLSRGERIDQRAMLRRLAELQYTRNEIELHRGTYRVRGELIDIFPGESERRGRARRACSMTRSSALAWFDPLTGEVTRKVPRPTRSSPRPTT
jgi:excinuclease ABC subunit B